VSLSSIYRITVLLVMKDFVSTSILKPLII
jgi:hypothetical protein